MNRCGHYNICVFPNLRREIAGDIAGRQVAQEFYDSPARPPGSNQLARGIRSLKRGQMASFRHLIRSAIAVLTPPVILRPARKLWRVMHGLGWYNFYGQWSTLADVPVTQENPGSDPWAQTIVAGKQQNLKTAAGPTCDDTGKLILPLLASQFADPLTVLDFGGGAGIGLANILKFSCLDLSRLSYVLVETPAMCPAVRREIGAHSWTVVEQIPDTLPAPLIVNASSSIQYIPDYRATVSQLAQLAPEIFIVSQTPIDRRSYLCVPGIEYPA